MVDPGEPVLIPPSVDEKSETLRGAGLDHTSWCPGHDMKRWQASREEEVVAVQVWEEQGVGSGGEEDSSPRGPCQRRLPAPTSLWAATGKSENRKIGKSGLAASAKG